MKGFNTEQELVNLFKISYTQKFDGSNIRILEEVGLGFGVADLVITELKEHVRIETRERLSTSELSVYNLVNRKRKVSFEEISRITRLRKNELNSALDRLTEYEYVKKVNSLFILNRNYELPFEKSIAFEAKLKNWKRAFTQAYRYKWFADYTYVIMDEAHAKPAIKSVSHFKDHNVGLLTISIDGKIENYFSPVRHYPVDPAMQMMLSENLLYQ